MRLTFRNVKTFWLLDFRKKRMILEALFALGWARILIAIPFSKVAPSLGTALKETEAQTSPEQEAVAREVSYVINKMSRKAFWECKCLVRAIAGMKMLERRRIGSTLYLGTAKDENGKLVAHAWLRSGHLYVSGADEMAKFSVVATFAKRIQDEGEGALE